MAMMCSKCGGTKADSFGNCVQGCSPRQEAPPVEPQCTAHPQHGVYYTNGRWCCMTCKKPRLDVPPAPPSQQASETGKCPKCGEVSTRHYAHCDKCEQYVGEFGEDACCQPDTALSLLIVDMGECCTIRRESGVWPDEIAALAFHNESLLARDTIMFVQTFEQVRVAIEGERPVPRVERRKTKSTATGDNVYLLFVDDEERRGVEHSQIT